MVAYPASLPDPFVGLTDARLPAVARTEMDAGPPKVRRRFTAAVRNFEVPYVLTGSERATFETFFVTTLKEGSLEFDWIDPLDLSTLTMRFREPPAWTLRAGGGSAAIWQTSLAIEVLP